MSEALESTSQRSVSSLMEALDLERRGGGVYCAAPAAPGDPRSIYGGHVAAQALRAAGLTVPMGRVAHSLHGYFLRPGDASRPIRYQVTADRDGAQFSERTVTAAQGEKVIFTMSASFQVSSAGPEFQRAAMPEGPPPEDLPTFELDPRMLDLEARVPPDPEQFHRWPTRLWVRVTGPLSDDPNLHASALAFISDMCTGLSKAPSVNQVGILPSLDHCLWIHRPAQLNGWVLIDLQPESTSNGRGLYTGRIFSESGVLVASLVQESLFRLRPKSQWVSP